MAELRGYREGYSSLYRILLEKKKWAIVNFGFH